MSGDLKRIKVFRLISQLTILCFALLVAACASEPVTPTTTSVLPTPISTPTGAPSDSSDGAPAEGSGLGEIASLDDIATIAAQRTPVPTREPNPVREVAQDIAEESGLDDVSFLGLTVTSWIDLAISILILVLFIFIGLKLIFALIKAIVRRTKTTFDDQFLDYAERELRWLIVILVIAQASVLRLDFLSERMRRILEDLFFLLALTVIYIIVLRFIHFVSVWYRRKKLSADQRKQLGPFIEMAKRLGYLLTSILVLSSALSHFGIEITMITAIVLFAAVVLILGARAAVSDAVSGFFILVSQPFRRNDTIYIKEMDTRGSVEEIGVRTTRIRARNGREVIVPNSLIGSSQIINYTYPDPNFRVEINFLAGDGDIDLIQDVITQAVRGVDGVLPDKPVDVLYLAYGGTGRQFRVRWWIDDANQHNRSRDKVNKTLDRALSEAGINSPNVAYDLNLSVTGGDGPLVIQSPTDRNAEGEKIEE